MCRIKDVLLKNYRLINMTIKIMKTIKKTLGRKILKICAILMAVEIAWTFFLKTTITISTTEIIISNPIKAKIFQLISTISEKLWARVNSSLSLRSKIACSQAFSTKKADTIKKWISKSYKKILTPISTMDSPPLLPNKN